MTPSWLSERLRAAPVEHALGLAREATVIGIGESSHHTAEHPVLRRDLLAALLREHRTILVALEAVPPGPNPIDDWITDSADARADAADALVVTGVRMWRNAETVALVELLREVNREGSARVRVHGIDVLTPGRVMRRVFALAPVLGLPLEESVDLAAITRDLDEDGVHDQASFDALGGYQRTELDRQLSAALLVVNRDEERLRTELGDEKFLALRRDVVVAVRALDTLWAGMGDWTAGLPARDRAMAENVATLVRSEPADRYVILSHNTHVAASRTANRDYAAMGTHLRRWFGSSYAAIGTTFTSARFDPPIYGIAEVPGHESGPANTVPVDALVAEAVAGSAWLQLRGDGPPLPVPLPLRTVGGVSTYDLAAAFDGLIHLPSLSSARQLVDTDLGLALPGRRS